MPNRVRAATKTAIRRLSRAAGYEIVPAAAGFAAVRRHVLTDLPTVVDVGANVGQYAERLFDLGYQGRIISFEPGKSAFDILQHKAETNPRWQVRQAALGDTTGNATLRVAANSVSSSLLDVGRRHVEAARNSKTIGTEVVTLSTLDAELADIADVPFYLKLDVQGFELQVLAGGRATLERTEAVQVEVSFDDLYEGQTRWLTLCEYLQDHGFTVRYVENGYEDPRTGYMLQADLLFSRS